MDQIFKALEDMAFDALRDGQIFIEQTLVWGYGGSRQMNEVLKDYGFLLLKKESHFYQFPHLTFQEFFGTQHLVHSLIGNNEERKRIAVEFLSENKYCANFRYMLCFMAQALTANKGEKGYKDLERIINDEPIALGYQQHLLLNFELLEASLSVLKQQDREKLLNSTKVLEIGFRCIRQSALDHDYEFVPHTVVNSLISDPKLAPTLPFGELDPKEKVTELLVKVAKVARYTPNRWKEVMEILNTNLSNNTCPREALSIIPLMRAIFEKSESLLELYWTLFESENVMIRVHLVSLLSDIVRLMPNNAKRVFEKYETEAYDNEEMVITALFEQGPRLAEVMPNMWPQILEIMEGLIIDYCVKHGSLQLNPLARLVELVPESDTEVMEVVQKLFKNPHQKIKKSLTRSCSTLISGLPNNALEITQMLWTLFDDDAMCDIAIFQVLRLMQSSGRNINLVVNELLKWSENDTQSSRSSLVKLAAIAHRLLDKPLEGVDHILSNFSEMNLKDLCLNTAITLQYLIGTKTEKEIAMHRLLVMFLKRLFSSEVDQSEQFTMIDVDIEDPKELARQSAKLLIRVEDSPLLAWISRFLLKLAIYCPEHEHDLLDKIYKLTEDEDSFIAMVACITATSVLDKKPQDAERMMNKYLQLMRDENMTAVLQVNDIVSLDVLLKTYVECPSDFLTFHITRELLYTPVTIEARGNGPPRLTIQTASTSKLIYTFQTDEEAKEFVSSVNVCTKVMFPEVASCMPELDASEVQQSKKSFFEKLRDNGGFY